MYGDPGLQNIYLNCGVYPLLQLAIRTTRQQRIRDCNYGDCFLIKAKWGGSQTCIFSTEVQNSR